MKVNALIDCEGLGYELKAGESANLKKDLAEKLIDFGYVEKAGENTDTDTETEVEETPEVVEEEQPPKETKVKK